ncbi:serine/threonine protein kinase [Escherichia coli]
MGSCAAPSAKGDDKFITTDYLQQCPWHYPNSPKNGKPVLSPHHDWLKTGSLRQNAPLRIWFYPQ